MSNQDKTYHCTIDLSLDLIGGKWKLRILYELNKGTKRFGELKKRIPTITQKMLVQQLREMEEDRLISRKEYAQVPPKVEYSSTEYGKQFQSILISLCQWTNDYAREQDIQIDVTEDLEN
ncbi:winged helix-turn-helix transcriptional regulator [Paenibacillus donghaensis]|uniref:winged helix-turn-helix transcriptional regulator n=1 Tax=Paenibacillus donghaensis TaxID=414771 RepID=UPI001883AAE2|nr:helix-turn-helix domain-containing protein [Paenibacillus donghaensis]MBE9914765.1 winged helix-turn-helix transcriptional regulator [Paenibacillus donghaensis]